MFKIYIMSTGIYEFLFDRLIVPMDYMEDYQISQRITIANMI